jgi:transposase
MNIIAMDIHMASIDAAVVNERGDLITRTRMATSEKLIIEFIQSIKKPRTVYIEEGTLAGWMVDLCHAHGENLIVTDPKQNRWIAKGGNKNDEVDALKLAHLARGGFIKPIPHAVTDRRRFRDIVLFYHQQVKNLVRLKNRIKCKFRQNGIPCSGKTVFLPKYRSHWSKKLPSDLTVHFMIDRLWQELAILDESIEKTEKRICSISNRYPEVKRFQEISGIGPIHSATISAIIHDPNRFATKKKLWMYAGLAVIQRGSGNEIYSTKLTRDFNHILKYSVMQAVRAAIRSSANPFRKKYLSFVLKGMPEHHAILSTARSLLTVIWTIWKRGELFDPKKVKILAE